MYPVTSAADSLVYAFKPDYMTLFLDVNFVRGWYSVAQGTVALV